MLRKLKAWLFYDADAELIALERAKQRVEETKRRREEEAAIHTKKLALMQELGGFDLWLTDHNKNWLRQFEIMVDLKRRIEDLENR